MYRCVIKEGGKESVSIQMLVKIWEKVFWKHSLLCEVEVQSKAEYKGIEDWGLNEHFKSHEKLR